MAKRKVFAFNQTQIKDGWIVKLRKNGTIKFRVEKYEPKHPNKTINGKG
jgi:hypothetical protein